MGKVRARGRRVERQFQVVPTLIAVGAFGIAIASVNLVFELGRLKSRFGTPPGLGSMSAGLASADEDIVPPEPSALPALPLPGMPSAEEPASPTGGRAAAPPAPAPAKVLPAHLAINAATLAEPPTAEGDADSPDSPAYKPLASDKVAKSEDRARNAFEEGEYRRALRIADRLVRKNPEDIEMRRVALLSACALGESDTDERLAAFPGVEAAQLGQQCMRLSAARREGAPEEP